MSGKWELDGTQLGSSDTKVIVSALRHTGGARQSLVDLHGGSQSRERLGTNLYTHDITFHFLGRGEDKFRELRDVVDVLETKNVWSLQAPTLDTTSFVYKDEKRAAFSTQDNGISVNIAGPGRIDLTVRAVMNGVWIANGGDFCEDKSGHFTLSGTDYVLSNNVGLEDQDGDNTSTTPLVTLPEQTDGYPLAVRASDFALAQPTLDSTSTTTIDGNTVTLETYDMTGFLIPAPSTSGDVGVFQICSSPTDAYLSGGEGFIEPNSDLDTFGFDDATAVGSVTTQGTSTVDTFGFDDATGTGTVTATGSSTVDTFGFDDATATGTLLLALTTEGGDPLTTEAGDTLIAQV